MVQKKSVSVIIPTYNELENIRILLPKIVKILTNRDYEILVVDDDSPDGTGREVLRMTRSNKKIRLISRKKKEGIGAALRHGYNLAKKDIIVSTDADLSFNPQDIRRLISTIEKGADLVVGNRHGKDSGYEKTTMLVWMKSIVSKIGNTVLTRLLFLPVQDLSANFRAIRRSAWKKLNTTEKGNAVLGEMIIKAHREEFVVQQISVIFRDRRYGESKLNLFKEAPKFMLTMLKYRF